MIILDARVVAVRADSKVGHGTCSYMDETMDDADLLKKIEDVGAKTPKAAVRAMRSLNAALMENDQEAADGYDFWKLS